MLEKIKKTIAEYKILYSSVTITLVLAIAQICIYIKKVSYYSYFNIDPCFIEMDLYNDLLVLFHNFILYLIIGIEMLLIDKTIMYVYRRRQNLKVIKQYTDIFAGALILYSILIFFNVSVDYLITGDIIITENSFIIPFIFIIFIIAFRLIQYFIKKGTVAESKEDKEISNLLTLLVALSFFILIQNIISDNGINKAKDLKGFYVTADNKIVLYKNKDYAIITDYECNSKNEIIINNSKRTKIYIDNITLEYKEFYKVTIKED